MDSEQTSAAAEEPPAGPTSNTLEGAARRLDSLVRTFEEHPVEEVRERVLEMLSLVDTLHREGIGRLVEILWKGSPTVLEEALADPGINLLLQLYDLAPLDLEPVEQVELALGTVRPYIESHGGAVEVLEVDEGVVHVRLSGACQGCAGSAMTLKRGIEAALREGYHGFKGIEVHEPPAQERTGIPGSFIPLQQIASARPLQRPVFTDVGMFSSLPPGTLRGVDTDGKRLLLCNVEGEIYAFRNACPGTDLPLDGGQLNGVAILCPWHNCAFDARTGKRLDGGEGRLDVIPVAIRDGAIQLALNVEPVALH